MKLSRLKRNKGFTLVEVVTVVGIVMCLAALSIHGLLRVRVNANDGAASGSIKSIAAAMESYRAVNNSYPSDLDTLINANPPYLSNAYADGNNQGFDFYIPFADNNGYAIWAQPEHFGVTGSKFLVYSQGGQEQFEGYESAAAYVNEVANMQLASADGVPGLPTGYVDGGGTDGDTDSYEEIISTLTETGRDGTILVDLPDPPSGVLEGGPPREETGTEEPPSGDEPVLVPEPEPIPILLQFTPIPIEEEPIHITAINLGGTTTGINQATIIIKPIVRTDIVKEGPIVRLPEKPIGILEPIDPGEGDDGTGVGCVAPDDPPDEQNEAASATGFN